ncbi:LysE family translocator [Stappia sp. BW2]|nr:LysE family translocator [Stappia sp. BW2]
MPTLETIVAMSGFAVAASATPGPVNIIGAMTGARYGMGQALIFVTGATASFLFILLACGAGLLGGAESITALQVPMIVIGSTYLIWMAVGLLRDDGVTDRPNFLRTPGFWSGVLVQGLNPKAWLAVVSSLSAFVLPLADPVTGLAVFAALFGAICWASLAMWAWGGAQITPNRMRLFNRAMALALVIAVTWMLGKTFG